MMIHEFEALAGYEVKWADYVNIIEPMYMALPENVSKQDFVKMINKQRFALKPLSKIEKEMGDIAKHLKDTCTHYTDYESKDKLNSLAQEYAERINATGFYINEQMLWTCYYPVSVVFYYKHTPTKSIDFCTIIN